MLLKGLVRDEVRKMGEQTTGENQKKKISNHRVAQRRVCARL